MAAVHFKLAGTTPTGKPRYKATVDPLGRALPKVAQTPGAEQLTPRPGQRNVVPTGTDRNTW